MNVLIEAMLKHRGLTVDDIKAFDCPDHLPLQGIDDVCERLHSIKQAGKHLVILPDFDMDGIMSGVTGIAGFKVLGFNVDLFIPDPQEGYGFGPTQVKRLMASFPDVKAIITCDTGISCFEGTRFAVEQGIEVIITDHHVETADNSPRELASSLVDPCGIDETYEHPGICGAHVLWQVLDHYARTYGTQTDVDRIYMLRVFAGVGTISDAMPLLYENRDLVREACSIAKSCWTADERFKSSMAGADQAYVNAFRGLYTVLEVFKDNRKLSDADSLDEDFFGFYLAPTFNAIKRMDGDMSRAFGIFTGNGLCRENIEYLFALNEQRKKETADAVEAIKAQDNPYAPYIYTTNAKPGLLGLLAMKLMEDTPVLVVSQNASGTYSGSGRSPQWYPFLTATENATVMAAGHEGAFGCSLGGDDDMASLFAFLSSDVPLIAAQQPATTEVDSDIVIATDGTGDAEVDTGLLIDFVNELQSLKPFGKGFEAPSILFDFDASEGEWSAIGAAKNHLKVKLDGVDIISWGRADVIEDGIPEGRIRVLGTVSLNEFRGNITPQLIGTVL